MGFARFFRTRSIASRLLLSAAVWSLAILVLAGFLLTAVYRRTTEQAFDERLGVYLKALVADVATAGDAQRQGPGQLGEPQFELTLSGWYWQVVRLDRDRPDVITSRSLFAARLPRLPESAQAPDSAARQGYVKGPDERRLRILERVIDAGDDGQFLIQVAADAANVEEPVADFRVNLTVAFALVALALMGSALLQVRFGLQPLRRLQNGVAAIRRGETDRIEGVFPTDIEPLAAELNLLAEANREIVIRARTQVGNLAHALKTPLTVMLNEADGGDSQLAGKVREQAGIMARQVGFYLDRARAATRAGNIGASADVGQIAAALMRTFAKIYRDKEVEFSADVSTSARFRGEAQDLEEMLGNLIDNAGKWAHGAVALSLEPAPVVAGRSYLALLVDDDGPGLPAASRQEATKRGRRLDETKPGSGLGLSIVTDLAALYGGRLELDDSPLGGLRARLILPAV